MTDFFERLTLKQLQQRYRVPDAHFNNDHIQLFHFPGCRYGLRLVEDHVHQSTFLTAVVMLDPGRAERGFSILPDMPVGFPHVRGNFPTQLTRDVVLGYLRWANDQTRYVATGQSEEEQLEQYIRARMLDFHIINDAGQESTFKEPGVVDALQIRTYQYEHTYLIGRVYDPLIAGRVDFCMDPTLARGDVRWGVLHYGTAPSRSHLMHLRKVYGFLRASLGEGTTQLVNPTHGLPPSPPARPKRKIRL